jgi:hypothetical protein
VREQAAPGNDPARCFSQYVSLGLVLFEADGPTARGDVSGSRLSTPKSFGGFRIFRSCPRYDKNRCVFNARTKAAPLQARGEAALHGADRIGLASEAALQGADRARLERFGRSQLACKLPLNRLGCLAF